MDFTSEAFASAGGAGGARYSIGCVLSRATRAPGRTAKRVGVEVACGRSADVATYHTGTP